MTTENENTPQVKSVGRVAPIRVMAIAVEALQEAVDNEGMIALIGKAGLGKTIAARRAMATHDAIYLRASIHWSPKSFLGDLLKELGVAVKINSCTTRELEQKAFEALSRTPQPLIIDEVDTLFDLSGKPTEAAFKKIETIRALHDYTNCPILMIGEEYFDTKVRPWERFHRRVLDFRQAPPADLDDARKLARVYAPRWALADDLLQFFVAGTQGSVSRIKQNVERAAGRCQLEAMTGMDLGDWQDRGLKLATGEVDHRRGQA